MIGGVDSNQIMLDCQICFEEYNINNRKPTVLDCGHSICNICLLGLMSQRNNLKKCPFDNKELKRTIDQYPINWAYIDIINSNLHF